MSPAAPKPALQTITPEGQRWLAENLSRSRGSNEALFNFITGTDRRAPIWRHIRHAVAPAFDWMHHLRHQHGMDREQAAGEVLTALRRCADTGEIFSLPGITDTEATPAPAKATTTATPGRLEEAKAVSRQLAEEMAAVPPRKVTPIRPDKIIPDPKHALNHDADKFIAAGQADDLQATDAGAAELLLYRHGDSIRWCRDWNTWLVYDGLRWNPDPDALEKLAKDPARMAYTLAAKAPGEDGRKRFSKWAIELERSRNVREMLWSARSEVAVKPDEFDQKPWLFNVENGTLDLKAGDLRAAWRSDFLTKQAPVTFDAHAQAPAWSRFLERVLPDESVRRFAQKAVGYSMTGDVGEQALFFLYGAGANGKSTFLRVLLDIFGDGYARQAPPDLLVKRRGGNNEAALALLYGNRLISTVETEAGAAMAESLFKSITGGDQVTARQLYQQHFSFNPTWKIWLAANHRPAIRGRDEAVWRHIKLIPFTVTIPPEERDHQLIDKLMAEAPGILRWALDGCLLWQKEGLDPPEAMIEAVDDYREDADELAEFLAQYEADPADKVPSGQLRGEYVSWCESTGVRPQSQQVFKAMLQERGLVYVKDKYGRFWRGIRRKA